MPLLERKLGALDHARSLVGWKLPECISVLRRRLEHEREKGTRDAIAQFLLPQESWSATTFTLDGREHLRHVKVAACDISRYRSLLTTGGMV